MFNRYRILLFTLSSIFSVYLGIVLYRYQLQKQNVLGTTTHITTLNKDFFISSPTASLKHFYELKPDQIWNDKPEWLATASTNTINKEGMHSQKSYTIEVLPNTYRTMTIGDSFTFGQFVDTSQNFSERLAGMLGTRSCEDKTQYEVLNLGVQGYDISYVIEHFLARGLKYQPNIVIWLINTHNVIPRDLLIEQYKKIEKTMPIASPSAQTQEGKFFTYWTQAEKKVVDTIGKPAIFAYQREYIKKFNRAYNGDLLVVIRDNVKDPDLLEFISQEFSHRPHTIIDTMLPDLEGKNGVLLDGHPNDSGHTILAAHIYNILRDHGLLYCL